MSGRNFRSHHESDNFQRKKEGGRKKLIKVDKGGSKKKISEEGLKKEVVTDAMRTCLKWKVHISSRLGPQKCLS